MFQFPTRPVFLLLAICCCAAFAAEKGNYNIQLWDDGKVPQSAGDGPLDRPFLTVFSPPAGKANGASVVIAPGGSHIMLMYCGAGLEIAAPKNQWGAYALVLKYPLTPRSNHGAPT